MPGHGGEPDGGRDRGGLPSPVQLTSALLTALASLGLGLVLGPEAPLTALGLTAGLVAARALRRGLRAGSRVMRGRRPTDRVVTVRIGWWQSGWSRPLTWPGHSTQDAVDAEHQPTDLTVWGVELTAALAQRLALPGAVRLLVGRVQAA
jgi:hypothetical protein